MNLWEVTSSYERKIVAEPRYIQFFANFSWKTARLPKEVCLPENEIRYLSFFSLAKKWCFPFFALISYYEIFQIQTPGGASFQEGTVCTIATYNPEQAEVGGGAIGYSSRKETPNGDYVNATGT